jgi:hypothetical protein
MKYVANRSIPELVTRYYKRRMPWVFLITFGGMTLAAGPWVWTERIRSMTCGLGFAWNTAVSLAALMLPFAIWFAVVVTWERRLMRRLGAAGYRLCPRCGYCLVAREGCIACPECGRACEVSEVERSWRAFRPRISGVVDAVLSLFERGPP